MAEYLPLCSAIQTGDWEKYQQLVNRDRVTPFTSLTETGNTTLDFAIWRGSSLHFLENLLNEMDPNILPDLINDSRANPAHCAAAVDNTDIAKMLVTKIPRVLFMNDCFGCLPIHTAIHLHHKKTFLYLLKASEEHTSIADDYSPFDGSFLVNEVIEAGFLGLPIGNSDNTNRVQDVESQDKHKDKFLIKCRSCFHAAMEFMGVILWKMLLQVLLVKNLKEDKVKHHTARMLLKFMCEEFSKSDDTELLRKQYYNALASAAKNNTSEPIEEIAKYFPQIDTVYIEEYPIIETVVINHSEQVYNLMAYQLNIDKSSMNTRIDKFGNTLLHLAGQLAPIDKLSKVSGAALQMQRELQWFQEVKNFTQPALRKYKNDKGETLLTMFRREHKELRKEREEWMKKTADSYTITTALIITMVFAAAITVPGGNNSDTGKAVYVKNSIFIIFAASDAISMLTATTSLLLFKSILKARYAEEDFLYRLPKRLILGLVNLFLSVAFMMVAFSASLYMLIGHGKAWILILIAVFGCLPVASIVALQLPLFVELVSLTYGRGMFGLLQACLIGISNGMKRLKMRYMAN